MKNSKATKAILALILVAAIVVGILAIAGVFNGEKQDDNKTDQTLTEKVENVVEEGKEAVENAVEEGKEAVENAVEEGKEAAENAVEEVKETVEEVKETVEEKVEEVKEGAEEVVEEAKDAVSEVVEEVKEAAGPIKVGIINLDPAESGYREANVNDMKNTFTAENGYDAKFVTAPTADKQLDAARGFITDGVKYILVSAADTTGWDEVLKEAQEAGIGVFLFDRMIDASPDLYTAAVVSDMNLEGDTAVAWLESLGLEEYKILHIKGQLGSAAQVGRSGALEKKAAEDEKWTIVREGTGGDSWDPEEARKIAQSAIDEGLDFNVVYAENDGMAQGVVKALDAAGITHGTADGAKVVVMGFDCNKWALVELLKGNWNYDGQCSPFQAAKIDEMIKTLEAGGAIEGLNELKQFINPEKGFDAKTLTEEDIEKYGLGE